MVSDYKEVGNTASDLNLVLDHDITRSRVTVRGNINCWRSITEPDKTRYYFPKIFTDNFCFLHPQIEGFTAAYLVGESSAPAYSKHYPN